MFIYKNKKDLREYLDKFAPQKSLGFVPTMGALHEGHKKLIERAVAENDLAICSIFVNPTQFNDPKDYDKYPQSLDKDIEFIYNSGIQVVFAPSVNEMYPDGSKLAVRYDLGTLETVLEGAFRPGHFQGVCQVVENLLSIVKPNKLYMGEKDFQQIAVIQKLIAIKNIPCQLIPCPTIREKSGLAKSSRNERLSEEGKQKAAKIFENLTLIKNKLDESAFLDLKKIAIGQLRKEQIETEYLELIMAEDLQKTDAYIKEKAQRLIIAAYLEGVRLIDNIAI